MKVFLGDVKPMKNPEARLQEVGWDDLRKKSIFCTFSVKKYWFMFLIDQSSRYNVKVTLAVFSIGSNKSAPYREVVNECNNSFN